MKVTELKNYFFQLNLNISCKSASEKNTNKFEILIF